MKKTPCGFHETKSHQKDDNFNGAGVHFSEVDAPEKVVMHDCFAK